MGSRRYVTTNAHGGHARDLRSLCVFRRGLFLGQAGLVPRVVPGPRRRIAGPRCRRLS